MSAERRRSRHQPRSRRRCAPCGCDGVASFIHRTHEVLERANVTSSTPPPAASAADASTASSWAARLYTDLARAAPGDQPLSSALFVDVAVQVHAQSWEVLKIISSLEAHSSVVSIRGRACGNRACAAARPLGQVWRIGGRGGVRRRAGMQYRGARGVRGVGGLTCYWPRARGTRTFSPLLRKGS